MSTVEYSTYTKKSTILALAQRDPSFAEFYLQYQNQIVLPTPLPVDFWGDVIAIAEKEPTLSSEIKRCRENTQAAQSFAIPGLPACLWAAVYIKSKNTKKYRHGVEYGSARWGTADDIKPFINPKFDQNILLTQTERIMVGRNKNPKYNINKNVLIIGGSGSGKTRFHIKPNLMQMNASYIVTDPKGLL